MPAAPPSGPRRRGRPVDARARQERTERILEAARRCFTRSGFHAASTAEISAEAGISVASLYQYFPTKDDLVLALVEADLQTDLEVVHVIAAAPTFAAGLHAASEAMLHDATLHAATRLRLEILVEATRNPAVAAALRRAEALMVDELATVLEHALARGELSFELPPQVAATLLIATTDGLYGRIAFAADAGRFASASEQFILRALGARDRG